MDPKSRFDDYSTDRKSQGWSERLATPYRRKQSRRWRCIRPEGTLHRSQRSIYPVTWDDPIMEGRNRLDRCLPIRTYKSMDAAIREVKKASEAPSGFLFSP